MEYSYKSARQIESDCATSLGLDESWLPWFRLPCDIDDTFDNLTLDSPSDDSNGTITCVYPLSYDSTFTNLSRRHPLSDDTILHNPRPLKKRRHCPREHRCTAHMNSGPYKGDRCIYTIRIGEGTFCGYHCRNKKQTV
jgi:hypothetical protein